MSDEPPGPIDPLETTADGEDLPTEIAPVGPEVPAGDLGTQDTASASISPDEPFPTASPTDSASAHGAVCPSCRAVGLPGARFCERCGGELIEGPEPMPRPRAPSKAEMPRVPTTDVIAPPVEEPSAPWRPALAPRARPQVPTTPYMPTSGSLGDEAGFLGRCPGCTERLTRHEESCRTCGRALAPPICLVAINPDGTEGRRYPPATGVVTIGRGGTELSIPDDLFLSPVHAKLQILPNSLSIEDQGSLNGVFVCIHASAPVGPGDTFVVGRQLLRLEAAGKPPAETRGEDGTKLLGSPAPDGEFVLVQLSVAGRVQNRYHMPRGGAVIGRVDGDVRFPEDRFVSGRHATLTFERGRATLTDLDSSNGSWLRTRRPVALVEGDEIYLGSQVLRISSGVEGQPLLGSD